MRRISVLAILLLVGCTNPLNLQTSREYFQGGKANAANGKWFNARMAFGRAWANAVTGNADDKVLAVYAYEYGRASGVICDWKESEKGLMKALEIDQKSGGPAYMSMAELARMYHVSGQLEKSRNYFEMAMVALDSVQADTRDQIGYLFLLTEYAEVASALHMQELAAALNARAAVVRQSIKADARQHDHTPYGQHCDQKSLSSRW